MQAMDTSLLLNTLQDEIAADERALDEKRAVVAFLRKRLAHETAVNPTSAVSPMRDFFAPREPRIRAPSHSTGVLASVYDAVMQLTGEFTVGMVEEKIRADGIQIQSTTPRASIATALGRMVERELVQVTYRGSGNVPNRYHRVIPSAPTQETDADLREDRVSAT